VRSSLDKPASAVEFDDTSSLEDMVEVAEATDVVEDAVASTDESVVTAEPWVL